MEAGAAFPPGACHFPQYGEECFKQLTAERLVTRMVKGFPRGSWEKEPGRRNEALDCRVYARAAAAIYGLDRFEERHWRRMEEALARSVERYDEPTPSARPSARPWARQVIQSGYMAREGQRRTELWPSASSAHVDAYPAAAFAFPMQSRKCADQAAARSGMF